jgi:AcrR family transcriptional regulator
MFFVSPDERTLLPLLSGPPSERSDAARNRESLLAAAERLIERCGVEGVTMDALAHEAGVGKGTVFRRFESRAGLMGALLSRSEADWQAQVISGPPPLGPGAPPYERLMAFGRSRIEANLRHADLLEAAGAAGGRSFAVLSFQATHVRYLLHEMGVTGDLPLLAGALLAPLEVTILKHLHVREGMSVDRLVAGWQDLARRVVAPQPVTQSAM